MDSVICRPSCHAVYVVVMDVSKSRSKAERAPVVASIAQPRACVYPERLPKCKCSCSCSCSLYLMAGGSRAPPGYRCKFRMQIEGICAVLCRQTGAHLRCGVNRTRNSLSKTVMSAIVAWHAHGRCVRTLVLRLVQPVNDDVALVDSQSIEILPYSHGQLVFVHSSFRFGAQHGR